MADWDDPQFWIKELNKSAQHRAKFSRQYEWDKIRNILDTGAQHVSLSADSKKQDTEELSASSFVNWLWAFAQTFIPAVYWRHPQVNVQPKRSMYQANTSFVEPIINGAFETTRFRQTLRRCLLDLLCYGHGWIKLGWFTRFGQVPVPGASNETRSFQKPSRIDSDINFVVDQPYAVRVSPERMYIDQDALDYEELRWVCQESYVPYEDARKDPYLKNTKDIAPLVFRSERQDSMLPISTSTEAETKENKWCRFYEIWDRERRVVRVLIQGSRKWNRVMDWPYPDIRGFPFKFLSVTDAIQSFYPVSPLLPWLPLVEELSFIRSIRMMHLQKMTPKVIVPSNVFDKDAMEAFEDPNVEIVVSKGDPRELFVFPGLKPDANLYASEDSVKNDIREISGFSEILSGQVPFSRIAATTSAIMERNATIRFDHYSERVAETIVDCAKDLFLIVRAYQSYPQVVQVTGDPDPNWIEITAEQLQGDYLFKLDLEEMSVASKQQKIKEAYDALIALSPFQEVKTEALLRDLISAMGKNNLNEYLRPAMGDPMDPNWENILMSQGIPVEPNPQEDFGLHLDVHAAYINSPEYSAMVAKAPAIGALFSEHVQKTNRMADMQQQLGPPVGTKAAQQGLTPSASQQQGQAQAGSQPVGGQGGGTGQQQLAQLMAQRRGI